MILGQTLHSHNIEDEEYQEVQIFQGGADSRHIESNFVQLPLDPIRSARTGNDPVTALCGDCTSE